MRKFIKILFVLLITLLALTGIKAKAETYLGYADSSSEPVKCTLVENNEEAVAYYVTYTFLPKEKNQGGSSFTPTMDVNPNWSDASLAERTAIALYWRCPFIKMDRAELYDAVMKVLYNGYPNNYSGIQAKYNLSNDEFRYITQYAILHFTSEGFDPNGTGDATALGFTDQSWIDTWESNSKYKAAYRELINTSNLTYSPYFRLDIYGSGDGIAGACTLLVAKTAYTKVHVTKVWDDNDNQDGIRPDKVVFQLLANGVEVAGQQLELDAENNWSSAFPGTNQEGRLDKYDSNGTPIEYTVKEVTEVSGYGAPVYQAGVSGDYGDHIEYTVTNARKAETTEISGTTIWDDKDNQDGKRPTSITVNLLAGGVKIDSKEVTADNDWKYTFTGLAKYKDSQEIKYSVTAEAVKDYETKVSGTDITNTHVPETIEISGTKTWDDNDDQDGKRPTSITVNLLVDGVKVDSKKVTADDDWKYSFKELAKYKAGQEIKYSITEEAVEDYEAKVSGTDITNTHTPETTDITVTKVWDDKDDKEKKRPDSIKVTLKANDKDIQTVTITAKDDWKCELTELPTYEKGKKIKYSLSEKDVPNYKNVSIEEDESGNFEITNQIKKKYQFPSVGGSGSISYYVIGLTAVLFALIFMVVRFYKNQVKL